MDAADTRDGAILDDTIAIGDAQMTRFAELIPAQEGQVNNVGPVAEKPLKEQRTISDVWAWVCRVWRCAWLGARAVLARLGLRASPRNHEHACHRAVEPEDTCQHVCDAVVST